MQQQGLAETVEWRPETQGPTINLVFAFADVV